MLKFLLFIAFFFFLIYYILILPFRPRRPVDDKRTHRRRPIDGNVNIDFDPGENKKSSKSGHKGGDYVDYEEVE